MLRSVAKRIIVAWPKCIADFFELAIDKVHRATDRSSSNRDSLSVGSIINVPATGKDIVGE